MCIERSKSLFSLFYVKHVYTIKTTNLILFGKFENAVDDKEKHSRTLTGANLR